MPSMTSLVGLMFEAGQELGAFGEEFLLRIPFGWSLSFVGKALASWLGILLSFLYLITINAELKYHTTLQSFCHRAENLPCQLRALLW